MKTDYSLKSAILSAMRAECIPAGCSGVWCVNKLGFDSPVLTERHGKPVILPAGTYTFLQRLTEGTLMHIPPGETVMEDTPFELRTHLGFALQARGRVLVTGLGLGCVVRGLLANPAVEHVTVIENSPDVLRLVTPYMPAERLKIIEADALEWAARNTDSFTCAWHDLWTNREAGEPHLDLWHARLMLYCKNKIPQQGAWAFNRQMKRHLALKGFRWMG